MSNAPPATSLSLGNNERLSRGIYPQSDGTFLVLLYTSSRTFCTRAGAERFFAKRVSL